MPNVTSGEFVQRSIENADWDAAVLADGYQSFLKLLGDEPNAQIGIKHPLAPLEQVLLANALTKALDSHSDMRAIQQKAESSNALLLGALNRYSGKAQLTLPWVTRGHGYAWAPTMGLYLSQLSARFDDAVSVLLSVAGAAGRLSPIRRQQLNSLLFHPLQNADQHGRRSDQRSTFTGVAARLVGSPTPETPSMQEYLAAVRDRFAVAAVSTPSLLELVVHDNGLGIAKHFYNASRLPNAPALETLDLFHEWERLNQAFERHQTSKPIGFRRATTSLAIPGVGLAGMLSALKQLRGYMELRTGRLRVYQWYREADVIPDQNLLRPHGLPAASQNFPGTVFRFFVSLDVAGRAPERAG